MDEQPKYKRIVLKLSGEAMAGSEGYGIDPIVVDNLARQIQDVLLLGVQVGVVVGGGNIWRGLSGASKGMDRATADYMGMLATVINALALMDALEKHGVEVQVQTAIEMKEVAEPYIRRRAITHLDKGRVGSAGSHPRQVALKQLYSAFHFMLSIRHNIFKHDTRSSQRCRWVHPSLPYEYYHKYSY